MASSHRDENSRSGGLGKIVHHGSGALGGKSGGSDSDLDEEDMLCLRLLTGGEHATSHGHADTSGSDLQSEANSSGTAASRRDTASPTSDSSQRSSLSSDHRNGAQKMVNQSLAGSAYYSDSDSERNMLQQLQQRVAELEAQLQAERESRLCQICMEANCNTVILPCTHAMYCAECLVPSLVHCPMCAGPILGKLECRMGWTQ
jgi:hypothetical protein